MSHRSAIFGIGLRELRVRAGMSAIELARRLGVVPSYVTDVEAGRRRPFRSQRIRVAALILGVDPCVLEALAAETRGVFPLASHTADHARAGRELFLAWGRLGPEQLADLVGLLRRPRP